MKLPKYFAIKCPTDYETNVLWTRFLKWLNKYGHKNGMRSEWDGDSVGCYYGTENTTQGTNVWSRISQFEEGTVEITLEQWDEIVNGFKLPEKWYCVITKENQEILENWRKSVCSGDHKKNVIFSKYCVLSSHWNDNSYYWTGELKHLESKGYQEITTEQFIKHVLKQKEMKDTILKEGDIVELLDIKYTVRKPEEQWYLKNSFPLDNSDEIFIRLGLNKQVLQRKTLGYSGVGAFPECETAEDLTKFVTAIQQEILKQEKQKEMKNRTISAANAQRIINIACENWKQKLAANWGFNIALSKDIEILEDFYQEMRKACTDSQNVLFDDIFGKDVEVYPDGTPCLVRTSNADTWTLRYANGKGEFYNVGRKSGTSSTWVYHMKLDINNLPVNQ